MAGYNIDAGRSIISLLYHDGKCEKYLDLLTMTRSAEIRAEINNSPQQSIIEAIKGILGNQQRQH